MADVSTNNSADQCSPAKKAKLEKDTATKNANTVHNAELCSSAFSVKRVLQNNCTRKQICVEGSFKGHEGSAVLILEKQTFSDDEQSLKELFDKGTVLQKLYSNDVYGNYEIFPVKKYNGNARLTGSDTSRFNFD